MTEIKTEVTRRRRAQIELPYDRVMAAARRIAEEEGHHLGELEWCLEMPDMSLGFLCTDPDRRKALRERIWLRLDEESTVVESVEEVAVV